VFEVALLEEAQPSPDAPPEATQDVAPLVFQVIVVWEPAVTVCGFAVSDVTAAGSGAGVTTSDAELGLLAPPAPVQTRL
jgi:hypothetical protein